MPAVAGAEGPECAPSPRSSITLPKVSIGAFTDCRRQIHDGAWSPSDRRPDRAQARGSASRVADGDHHSAGAGIADHEALAIETARVNLEVPLPVIQHLITRYRRRRRRSDIIRPSPNRCAARTRTSTIGAEVVHVIRSRVRPSPLRHRPATNTVGAAGHPGADARDAPHRGARARLVAGAHARGSPTSSALRAVSSSRQNSTERIGGGPRRFAKHSDLPPSCCRQIHVASVT